MEPGDYIAMISLFGTAAATAAAGVAAWAVMRQQVSSSNEAIAKIAASLDDHEKELGEIPRLSDRVKRIEQSVSDLVGMHKTVDRMDVTLARVVADVERIAAAIELGGLSMSRGMSFGSPTVDDAVVLRALARLLGAGKQAAK